MPLPQKSSTLQIALPTVVPIIVAWWSAQATLLFGERYGMGMMPFILVGWCAVLFGSGVWLNHVLFRRVKTLLPFLAAIVTILCVWSWQKLAFASLIPSEGLTYGYFLKPEGAHARFWILACPFWVGLASLTICWVAALVSGWKMGGRRSLLCMVPWWLAAAIVFSLPSMYLDAQGNASIFI
jgi:hypothetical protein